MILVQYYVFIKYFNQSDGTADGGSQPNRSLNERYQLPDVSNVSFAWRAQRKHTQAKSRKKVYSALDAITNAKCLQHSHFLFSSLSFYSSSFVCAGLVHASVGIGKHPIARHRQPYTDDSIQFDISIFIFRASEREQSSKMVPP